MLISTIKDFADLIGGELRLGTLPPVGGELEPLGRFCFELPRLQTGDLYCSLNDRHGLASDEAFQFGAMGIVSPLVSIEPWPGCYVIFTREPAAAYDAIIAAMPAIVGGGRSDEEEADKTTSNSEIDVDELGGIHEITPHLRDAKRSASPPALFPKNHPLNHHGSDSFSQSNRSPYSNN